MTDADLDADLDVAPTADGFRCTFVVTNRGSAPVELAFRSGLVADVEVRRAGELVWRWSDGRVFTQALRSETLAPGASLDHAVTWVPPKPGSYDVVATLEAAGVEVEARADVEA